MVNEIIGKGNLQTLFAEAEKNDSSVLRMHGILPFFRDRLGQMPYRSPDFETVSPIGEDNKS